MPEKKRLTRRQMLKGLGAALGVVLAGCGKRLTPTPEKAQPTVGPTATLPPTLSPTTTLEPMTSDGQLPTAERFFAYSFQAAAMGSGRRHLPISFRYDDREAASFLQDWQVQVVAGSSAAGAALHTVTLTDPQTGLECRCEVTTFADFPAVEWVIYFKNTGSADTPVIADILPLDVAFPLSPSRPCQLRHAKGSQAQFDDFAPLETPLNPGGGYRLTPYDGRSSEGALPFFNLMAGDQGVIMAIGWTGGWQADFDRGEDGVRIRAGMPRTYLKLHPGEEIRTPRILLLFWRGEPIHGHNLLRRFILAHHTPRPNGQLLLVPIADAVWGERLVQDQIAKARWLKDNRLPVEYFWVDAGWYGDAPYDPKADTFGATWYQQAGNWYPNKNTYPDGLKPLGDALKSMGLGFVLWIEPERVHKETQLAREHPEWLLGPVGDDYLFNLGDPAARRFLTDRISALISEGGVTCYRQDFNMDPSLFWQMADAPDRVGMTEIRHIEGLYAFWDELLARHPGLIIDNCSSGGRRIDLETISRSVPLWRSDVQVSGDFNPITMQTQTQGLSLWVPLSAGCCRAPDTYAFRSALGPGIVLDWSSRALEMKVDFPAKLPLARKLLAELQAVRKYFYGDFYPLTPFSLSQSTWTVWQFDRPDLGEGMVLALRRPQNAETNREVRLQALDLNGEYELRSLDTDAVTRLAGRELVEKGLRIEITDAPGSALFVYRTRVGTAQ